MAARRRPPAPSLATEHAISIEVFVPVDGSSLADEAVAHAAEIARRTEGALHLVRVMKPEGAPAAPSGAAPAKVGRAGDDDVRAAARELLWRRARALSRLNDIPVTSELRVGEPETEIVLALTERASRLVVCTTQGAGGAASSWLGRVADGILRHAHCPVLAMSPGAVAHDVTVRRVLILQDGSEASGAVVPHAAWLAHAFAAEIDFLRLVHPLEDPSAAIREYIARTHPDIIALTTRGRGVSRPYLGGMADELVRTGNRPVLLCRPRDEARSNPAAA